MESERYDNGPILTVVIPVYNGEKYISRAVKSVVEQPNGERIEILVINDGSTDGSEMVCDRLAEKYHNIRIISKENGGVSSARNMGIQNAHTKYIAFLDCDDWWEPGFFDDAIAEEFEKSASADVYQFAYQEMENYCRLRKVFPVSEQDVFYIQPGLGRYDWAHHCSFVFRTELLMRNKVMYPVSKVGEDGPFVEMALFHAGFVKKIDRVIFTYWKNTHSCVHTTMRITAIKEEYKAGIQTQKYLADYGCDYDADESLVWTISNSLPQLCAECSYKEIKQFMEEYCLPILDSRTDIHFRKELWDRLASWRSKPFAFWIENKFRVGIPLRIRKILFIFPGAAKAFTYLYFRYHHGFIPVEPSREAH